MESSIIDQLRLQEGRLFQNEHVLALYLDVKAVVLEASQDVLKMSNPDDDFLMKMEKSLLVLAPSGTQQYHVKSVYESVKTTAKLLWPTELFLVAKPKLSTLLKGMCTRLAAVDQVKSGSFATLDPIKQDFVVRETFRRTIVNDCLVVFEEEKVGPDDSVSQVPEQHHERARRPSDARSALDSESESELVDELANFKEQDNRSLKYSASVAPSVAPRLVSSMSTFSKSSQSTGVTSSSFRQPLNIRKVHIEMDKE